jgi:hypothetical protein
VNLDVFHPLSAHVPVRLRTELSLRALSYAKTRSLLHERSDGQIPSIIFGRDETGRHGNFHPHAYQRICACDKWAKRLDKVHTASRRMKVRSDWQWKELDCSNSSDALLMNVFCYPGTSQLAGLRSQLNLEDEAAEPAFGFKPRIPLQRGRTDNSEMDMKIGGLLVEAKLTESDFQWATAGLLSRYRDLEAVFDLSILPSRNEKYRGYQLIRGALAAYALDCSFCVFCDARRPDLVEDWFAVLCAVRSAELRCRLGLVTWQELASALSYDQQQFLEEKYGIVPTTNYEGGPYRPLI